MNFIVVIAVVVTLPSYSVKFQILAETCVLHESNTEVKVILGSTKAYHSS
jgi:hypothetical protein